MNVKPTRYLECITMYGNQFILIIKLQRPHRLTLKLCNTVKCCMGKPAMLRINYKKEEQIGRLSKHIVRR